MFKKNILTALGLSFHSVILGKLVILAGAGGWVSWGTSWVLTPALLCVPLDHCIEEGQPRGPLRALS